MQTQDLKLIVNPSPADSPVFLTRERVDLFNSICWLFMDAFWMFNLPKVGLLLGIPTLISGMVLFYRDRYRSTLWLNLSTNCWIIMNVLWMLSDTYAQYETQYLTAAKCFLLIGMTFVGIGTIKNGSISDSIAHYKRYKSLGEDKKIRAVK